MTETTEEVLPIAENTPEQVIPIQLTEGWKTEPTPANAPIIATDPVIEEKDEKIAEEKPTSDKPDEPEKIPEATPHPVQDRPENTDPRTKEQEPLKFANEESEKVFNLLKEGKLDDVYTVLAEQKKLSTADKLPPADIIKLNLQYQNKDFTPQEINELFEDTYTMPEKPEQGSMEDDDEFKKREEKYKAQVEKIENRIKRDAKPAAAQLQQLAKEITLPDIQRQLPVNNEPTQEELAAQKEQVEKFNQSVDLGLQNFNGYQATFKDEEVTIPVSYKMTKEEKDAIRPLLQLSHTDGGEFLNKIGWVDKQGQINAAKIAEDLPFILNRDKILSTIVSETGNKRHEASVKSIKNIDYSGVKKANGDTGENPEQAQKKMATHFFSQ